MDRRALLEAMAAGGSAGVRQYQEYQSRVAAVDDAAYQGIVSDVGDDPAYRDMLSRYTDPYAQDATVAQQNYGEQLGYEQTAMAGMRDDFSHDLSRRQYEMSMRNQTEDVLRNAQRAASQAQTSAYDDMTQAEMRAMATGGADVLQGRVDERLKEKSIESGVFGLGLQGIGAAVGAIAESPWVDPETRGGALQELLLTRHPTRTAPSGVEVPDEAARWADALEASTKIRTSAEEEQAGIRATAARLGEHGRGMSRDAAEQMAGRNLLPMYRRQFGEQALLGMGIDPLTAAGFASEWFKPADQINERDAEDRAYNQLMYGNPDGPEGIADEARKESEDYNDALLFDVERQTGIPAAAIQSAGNDALLSTEQVAAIVTDDAWQAVDEKAREFADEGDIDGYLTWLEENADKQTQMLAINLYDPLFG